MATFAQIVGGEALNICVGDNLIDALAATFSPGFAGAGVRWQLVPDSTTGGAAVTVDENGNVTGSSNPTPPPKPSPPLDKTDFNLLCFAALGGGSTGIAAFQAIIDAATAAGGAARGIVTHYTGATNFVIADVEGFFAIMIAANCMTQDQANAVIAMWPA